MIHSSTTHSSSKKAKEYLAGWQRARAELDNFRKRTSEERDQYSKQAKKNLIQDLMPLIDNFQAMTKHVPKEIADNPWTEGVLHIARQLEQLLEEYNVKPIKAKGKKFDPNLHEAVSSVKNKQASGKIIEVLQTGYTYDDEVLRPAKVKVAK